MALIASNISWPVEKLAEAPIAFDSSYPTGGEPISASAFGLAQINRIDFNPTGAASGGAGYSYAATVASGGLTANILVFQAPITGPGALTQVPNATNLSAITALPVRVYGY